MAVSQPSTKRDGTIAIKDGAGSPLTTTVAYEDGDLSIEGLTSGGTNPLPFSDRGVQYGLRDGDDHPVNFTFTAHLMEIFDATNKTIADAFLKTGTYSAATSTWGANVADRYTVTVVWTVEETDRGGAADNTVTLTYCTAEVSFSEGEPNKISIKGTAYPKDSTLAVIRA